MMFEIRRPTNPIAVPPGELGGHRLADELRQRVGRLGSRLDRLVDRREGRRRVERQAEHRLARRPHDAADARGRPRPRTRCRWTWALIRKVSPSGRSPGAGIAAKWTTASAPLSASSVCPRSVRSVTRHPPGRAAVVAGVDVEDVVAVLAQVAHDPRPALAAASGDHDPHLPHLLAASMTMAGWTRGGIRVRRQPPGPGRDRRRSRPMTPRRARSGSIGEPVVARGTDVVARRDEDDDPAGGQGHDPDVAVHVEAAAGRLADEPDPALPRGRP